MNDIIKWKKEVDEALTRFLKSRNLKMARFCEGVYNPVFLQILVDEILYTNHYDVRLKSNEALGKGRVFKRGIKEIVLRNFTRHKQRYKQYRRNRRFI